MAADSVVIDMTKMTQMQFDSASGTIVCESGCTWADLILYLNQFGMSPRTMQSYSTFSVGGTLAVNGHGITTDFSLSECVESFRLLKADGQEVCCARGAGGEGGDLFKLALGGYGLFGIMWQVTMRVEPNSRMDMEALHLNADEFMRYHAAARASEDVVMKLARLNILETDNIDFFVFRRSHEKDIRLVSKLDRKPREMSWQSRLMYKWLMPIMKEVRYAIEKKSGTALDWGSETERNHMLHESAVPIAQLYEPLFQVDDTFLLQEYFCPCSQFKSWISRTKPIYKRLAATTEVVLLNTTIRFVEQDVDTFLPYAKDQEGMFAFVLYYRLPRTAAADAKMKEFHDWFVKETLALNGSFYLPYRRHYSFEQLEAAYPQIQDFFAKKEVYDPLGLFDNLWFRHYGAKYLSEPYKIALSQPVVATSSLAPRITEIRVPQVPTRRANAFRDLLSNPLLRQNFKDGFLTQIFNVMDHEQLFRMILKAARDPENRDDIEIYRALQRQVNESSGPVGAALKTWKQLNQLSAQKSELTREVCSIVSHLGKFGQLHDLLSIGDAGRLVLSLRRALHMKGQCWVAHDAFSEDVPAVMERGSLDPVGTHVSWQLMEAGPFLEVPDASVDLVTMMQGLHHIPQQHLPGFLQEVVRVLRPGGLFLFREHDALPALMPMLELAHSVFNAVMGVTDKEEEMELRAFRPLSEWRQILETTGLEDSMLFEMEPYDPTLDEMICFYKPPLHLPRPSAPLVADVPDVVPNQLPEAVASFVETAPKVLLRGILDAIDGLLDTLPSAVAIFKERLKAFSSGQQLVAQSLVDQAAEPVLKILENLRPLLAQVDFTSPADSSFANVIPAEAFLVVPALMQKVKNGKASANEMFAAAVIKDILDTLQGQKADGPKKTEEAAAVEVTKQEVETLLRKVLEEFPQLQEENAIEGMGFPKRATQVVLSRMGNISNVGEVADLLAAYLDEEAWIEFRAALLEALHDKVPPSADAIFRPKTTWARALTAFLGSRHVQPRSQALMMCQYVGLEQLPGMWRTAQALRRSQQSQQSHGVVSPAPIRSPEDAERKRNLQRALNGLTPPLRRVEMTEGHQRDICDVAEVVSASFGYYSITARPHDVTGQVQQMVSNGKLCLRNVDLCRAFGVGGAADGLRRVATGNTRQLEIRYRSNQVMPPEHLLPRITAVLERLRHSGWTEDRHSDDGEYTWYKLNEWMQVEILQIFGQSLETEPWYRFPYIQFMKVYFDVLFQESNIVQEKLGLKKAFGSMAFVTSLVPGLLMTVLFAQMKLLAIPLLSMPRFGFGGFGESYDESRAREQLVVLRPKDAPKVDWKNLDERITDITSPVEGLFIMKVPTFKALTDICKILAQDENMTVLQISAQKQVQVKVSAKGNDATINRELSSLAGCEIVSRFAYPTDGVPGPASTQWALCIDVPYLLSTIRACDQRGICVEQIYDFYC